MKTRGNTNLVLSWLINGEKGSFPVEVRRSRALLKLPFYPTEDIFYPPETMKALLFRSWYEILNSKGNCTQT